MVLNLHNRTSAESTKNQPLKISAFTVLGKNVLGENVKHGICFIVVFLISSILQALRSLVAMNENLKKQEQEFKAHCKEEMARLKANIEKIKQETDSELSEDQVRM